MAGLVVLAGCSDSLSSDSSMTSISTSITSTSASTISAAVVKFAPTALVDASYTHTAPLPIIIQRRISDGSWVAVGSIDGPLTSLADLPDGEYRLWDFDILLGEFTVERG